MTDLLSLPRGLCVCGRPRHRGMCSERWALRRSGDGAPPRPPLQHSAPGTPKRRFTGRAIHELNGHPRCWIRFSDGAEGQFRAVTVDSIDQAHAAGAVVCPVQTERTDCCGTCALCWSTPKTIAFLRH